MAKNGSFFDSDATSQAVTLKRWWKTTALSPKKPLPTSKLLRAQEFMSLFYSLKNCLNPLVC
jgi:hypothetical protein